MWVVASNSQEITVSFFFFFWQQYSNGMLLAILGYCLDVQFLVLKKNDNKN